MRTTDRRLATVSAEVAASLAVAGLLGGCSSTSAKLSAHDAVENLQKAKAASFTLHLDDPHGELLASSTTPSDRREAKVVEGSSLQVTVDPEGDQTLGQAGSAGSTPSATADPATELAHSGTFAMVWQHGGKDVATLRSISGVLYARIDPAAYQDAVGSPLPLDAESAPMFASVLDGIKAGKWLRLDLTSVYAKLKAAGLDQSSSSLGVQQVDPTTARRLASDLLGAASVATTVKKDGGTTTVDWSADVRKTLDAWLRILQEPAYAKLFGAASSSLAAQQPKVDQLPGTPVTGTLTVKDDHLTQATLDLASVAALSKDPDAKAVKTARLVVDIDDSPAAVTAPPADDVVQLDQLVDLALGSLKQLRSAAAPSASALTS